MHEEDWRIPDFWERLLYVIYCGVFTFVGALDRIFYIEEIWQTWLKEKDRI